MDHDSEEGASKRLEVSARRAMLGGIAVGIFGGVTGSIPLIAGACLTCLAAKAIPAGISFCESCWRSEEASLSTVLPELARDQQPAPGIESDSGDRRFQKLVARERKPNSHALR